MDDDDKFKSNDGTVGYGNPPEETRFKKGTSGNPKGRPKGARNLATVLEKTLREKVIVNENGTRKKVMKLEAALKQLVNKAAAGDLVAMRLLSALVSSEGNTGPSDANTTAPAESDQKIMNRLLEKMEKSRRVKDGNDK